jgi:hypothetical protein
MKINIFFIIAGVCLQVLCFTAQAQTITKYGDDVSTLDGIIKAYYGVVSVKKGEAVSYERDSLLHVPQAKVGIVQMEQGTPRLHYITLKQYHLYADSGLQSNGFDEREIGRKVEQFGTEYHVWSTYESRNSPDGPVIERGINSVELYFDGSRFWIVFWMFDSERAGNPLP